MIRIIKLMGLYSILLSLVGCSTAMSNDDKFDWRATESAPDHYSRELGLLRPNIEKGLPCGSDRFIERLEKMAGHSLQFLPQGRPKYEE